MSLLKPFSQQNYFNPLRPQGRRPCFLGLSSSPSNFNPLRPQGRRLGYSIVPNSMIEISTHSARKDGDTPLLLYGTEAQQFQPTPPARTETCFSDALITAVPISTHSARKDGDLQPGRPLSLVQNISTHSARKDGDEISRPFSMFACHFNPLRPQGRRLQYYTKNQQFFITFPQSNHIILPQITANLPCTHPKPFSLCSFSGANPPVNSCLLLVRTKLFETSLPPAARSEYQRLFHFNPFTHPNMFNLCSVFISQVVKSKAVSLLINDICQYGF